MVALRNLGNLNRYKADYSQAERYYEKSLELCREYDLKDDASKNLYFMALLDLQRDDYASAARSFTGYYDSAWLLYEKKSACDLLFGLAAVAGGTGLPERAARLNGAAQAALDQIDLPYPPFDRAEFDRHIHLARRDLGEEQFVVLENEGRGMALEEAVEEALRGV